MARTFTASSSMYGTATAPATDAPLTIAGWVKLASTGSARVIGGVGDPNVAAWTGHYIDVTNAQVLRAITANNNTFAVATAGTLTGSTWAHVCGVFASATSRTAYLNGTAGTPDTTNLTPSYGGAIWRQASGLTNTPNTFWDGDQGEFAVWSAALTAAEIASLAMGISPMLVRPHSIEAYWPMHGRTSPENEWFNAYALTLQNSPTVAAHPRIIEFQPHVFGGYVAPASEEGETLTFTASDSIAASDTVDRACQNLRAVADDIGITDTVERVVAAVREISDSLAFDDTPTIIVEWFRAAIEQLAYSDEFVRQVDYYRAIVDSIAILEELITALNGVVITPPEEEEAEAESGPQDVEEDLYAWILGCHLVTGLIGTRLYPVEAPQKAVRPLIVYELMTRDRDDTQAGESGLVRMVVQFDIQAASYLEVRLVEEALRRPFYQMMHERMGTTFVQSAEIADATDSDSPPVFADALGVYHSRIDLELWYEEAEPE